jgi:xylulokinase
MFVTIAYFPGGIMMEWLANLLSGRKDISEEDQHRFNELESAVPAGPTGLLITPHLIGTCNPEFDAQARAAIVGLTINSTRSHLYKGVLEGIASELAIVTEWMKQAGLDFEDLNVFGGGTRSALGIRLRAAMTRKRLHIMNCQEAVCLGGAILASVAIGVYPDLPAAVQAMVREQDCVIADPFLSEQYGQQFRQYRHLRSLLVHRGHPQNDQLRESS